MQTGRSFFMVECSLKSNIKIYAKILSFVCILWIIAAGWYYFIPYRDSMLRFQKITNWRIPRYMFYLFSIKESLYQMRWLPIALLPCTIFLFHWISKKKKEEIKAEAFVPREDFKPRTEIDIKEIMRTLRTKTKKNKSPK